MRSLLLIALATLAGTTAQAASFIQQANLTGSAGATIALDRDSVGNLYALGLPGLLRLMRSQATRLLISSH